MARISSAMESLTQALKDESKPWIKLFATAEKKTGVERLYLFIGSIAFLILYLIFGWAQQLLCNVIGFVYPAYCSMKALETQKKDDDTKWLTYWVVFAVFTVIEFFSEFIVCWFPFYWLVKCVLYVWLMAPIQNNGSLFLYQRFIRPTFLRYQPQLDSIMSSAKDSAIKLTADALLTQKQD